MGGPEGLDPAVRVRITALVQRAPHAARDSSFVVLGRWGTAMENGDTVRAARLLSLVRAIGAAADPDLESALTAELAARLEASVREAPEQYFWFHRRWKSKPRGEPDAATSGIPRAGGAGEDDAEQDGL